MDGSRQWEAVLGDMLRGVGGGLVFGVSLLYTMEVWWLGQTAQPQHALIALGVTFVPVFLLVASGGFRKKPDLTRLGVFVDVVTVIGLGIASVAVVLVILQRITPATPLPNATQMIVFEAAPFAIGAAVAREVFSGASDQSQRPPPWAGWRGTAAHPLYRHRPGTTLDRCQPTRIAFGGPPDEPHTHSPHDP